MLTQLLFWMKNVFFILFFLLQCEVTLPGHFHKSQQSQQNLTPYVKNKNKKQIDKEGPLVDLCNITLHKFTNMAVWTVVSHLTFR